MKLVRQLSVLNTSSHTLPCPQSMALHHSTAHFGGGGTPQRLVSVLQRLSDTQVLLSTWNGNSTVVATLRALRRVVNVELGGGPAARRDALALVTPLVSLVTTGTPHAVVASCLQCLAAACPVVVALDDVRGGAPWHSAAAALNAVCAAVLHYKVLPSPETDDDVLFLLGLDVRVCVCVCVCALLSSLYLLTLRYHFHHRFLCPAFAPTRAGSSPTKPFPSSWMLALR